MQLRVKHTILPGWLENSENFKFVFGLNFSLSVSLLFSSVHFPRMSLFSLLIFGHISGFCIFISCPQSFSSIYLSILFIHFTFFISYAQQCSSEVGTLLPTSVYKTVFPVFVPSTIFQESGVSAMEVLFTSTKLRK